ncbi:unnamed protein product, partial [Prorocentrum cordatum]
RWWMHWDPHLLNIVSMQYLGTVRCAVGRSDPSGSTAAGWHSTSHGGGRTTSLKIELVLATRERRRPARRPLQPRGAHPRGGGAPIHAPAQPGAPRCGGDRRRARRRGRPQQPPGGLRAQPAVGGLLRRLRHRGAAPRRLRAWRSVLAVLADQVLHLWQLPDCGGARLQRAGDLRRQGFHVPAHRPRHHLRRPRRERRWPTPRSARPRRSGSCCPALSRGSPRGGGGGAPTWNPSRRARSMPR